MYSNRKALFDILILLYNIAAIVCIRDLFQSVLSFVSAQWLSSWSEVRWCRQKPLTRSPSTSVTLWASPHYQPKAHRCRSETLCRGVIQWTFLKQTHTNNYRLILFFTVTIMSAVLNYSWSICWFASATGGDAAEWSLHLLWCNHRQFWRVQGNSR